MNNSTSSHSTDYRLYFYTQLATGICLAILSPITITSNVLLLLTIFKDPLKCFRVPATYFIIALASVDLATGLLVEPFFIVDRVARYVKWSSAPGEPYHTLHLTNWNLVVLRGPQRVLFACSWSHFDAVHRHNIPAPLSLRSDNTQGPRLCWVLVGVLHWIHSVAVRWGCPSNIISSRSPSSLDSDNGFAYPQFCDAFEVISPIRQRISSSWRPAQS